MMKRHPDTDRIRVSGHHSDPGRQYRPELITKATEFGEDGTNSPQILLSGRAHTETGHGHPKAWAAGGHLYIHRVES